MNILFVCHGNICRSPMAESVMTRVLEERHLSDEVHVDSAAAHDDALGCPPHAGTRRKLEEVGVPLVPHRARLMTRADGEKYDLLVGMDDYNVRDMKRIVGAANADKVVRLLDFTAAPRSVADPWYTGDFDRTYADVVEGVNALVAYLETRMG